MDGLNVFFRAFFGYKKKTAANKQIRKTCEAIENAPTDSDALEMVRTQCIIEEDWILAIEEGLEHVEKAIHEERQFIRKEGEVVPIEKLKRVSTDTVRHLAKHSNLITREPEPDEDLLPEKLYMAENLSDFAVYENRFLYMLLCYTRDFIHLRLDKILELGKTCRVTMNTEKHTRIGKKSIKYTSSLHYEDKNDSLASAGQSALIERIETAQRLVVALLMTPLMKEVSKAPMLSPPITRTNVLRMNVHFKAALEMYGKLSAYDKDGYIIQTKKQQFRPFPDAMNTELSETIALHTFLAYKYGNQLSERLRAGYEQEEKEEVLRQRQELEARIQRVKNDLAEKKASPEEFILMLEEQIKYLEKDTVELKQSKEQIVRLNERISAQEAEAETLRGQMLALHQTIGEKEQAIKEQARVHAVEQEELKNAHKAALQEKEDACNAILLEKEDACKTRIAQAEKEKMDAMQETALARKENAVIDEQRLTAQAQLHGIRERFGLIGKDEEHTSKAEFEELEKEYEAFEKFFKAQWQKTKKRIRKDILGAKRED